jgi:hypothetical protein
MLHILSTQYLCFAAKQGGVSHYGLAIYINKYLKAKEELRKLKYFKRSKI